MPEIIDTIRACPQHRFYLLTKQDQNLVKFNPLPDNCWVGVTATNSIMAYDAVSHLRGIKAKVKYISCEPLLEDFRDNSRGMPSHLALFVDWVIIGACTGTREDMLELIKQYQGLTLMPFGKKWTAQPKLEWVTEIIGAADKAGIAVFLKDNLLKIYPELLKRQEMPRVDSTTEEIDG